MQRGVERAGVHLQHVLRASADHLRDPVAVARTPAQGLQDDEIERALEQLESGEWLARTGHRGTSQGCRRSTPLGVGCLHPYEVSSARTTPPADRAARTPRAPH